MITMDPQWQATAALALVARGRVQVWRDGWAVPPEVNPHRRITPWCKAIQDQLRVAQDNHLIEICAVPLGVARLTPAGQHTLSWRLHRALELMEA